MLNFYKSKINTFDNVRNNLWIFTAYN
jgi:hypothetical protein